MKMNPSSLRLSFLAALLALAACGDARNSDRVMVRDSAGIAIVENMGDPWAAAERWTMSQEPALRIGAAEGEDAYLFDDVRRVLVLRDGRIVVANRGDHTLRWYDARGRFLFQAGGSGEGPGEFRRLHDIALAAGDTVVAVDWSGRRLSVFSPDGEHVRTSPIVGLTAPPGRAYPLSAGAYVIGVSGSSSAMLGKNLEEGLYRPTSPLLIVSTDGVGIDTLGNFPGLEIKVQPHEGGMMFGPPHFARNSSYAVADDRIHVGTQERFTIDVFEPNGQLVRSIRAPAVDLRVTPEVDAAFRDVLRGRLANVSPEQRAEAERSIAGIELPDSLPAYASLLLDDQSNLWVGEYRYDDRSSRRYLVFDAEGRFITPITLPDRFTLLSVTRDHVWGRLTDDLDVQYVVSFAIEN